MLFYYKNGKKVLNKVLYNIKITIFASEIKSESLLDRMILSMSNLNCKANVERKSWCNCRYYLECTE